MLTSTSSPSRISELPPRASPIARIERAHAPPSETLASAMQKLGARALEPAELSRLIAIMLRVCDAVALAHARGVIHGTLDPSSIVLGDDDAVAVQSAGTQLRLVSAAYFSTEQAWGRRADIDARTDVQGIGGILFTILTLRAPHEQPSFDLELAAARRGVTEPPQELCPDRPLPAALCRIASRALAASPAERYPSVALLKQDLERFMCSFPTPVNRSGSPALKAVVSLQS